MMKRQGAEESGSLTNWLEGRIDQAGLRREVDELVDQMMIQQRLTEMREQAGMTQRELARRVGVSQPVIARMESRRIRNVTLKTLVRAASALGATLKIDVTPGKRHRTAVRRSRAAGTN